jgi:MinD-like ATPase involved in chromosome partitioning or flagellar assembly
MRAKLYRAADAQGAMAQVQAELGPDALIVATRRVPGGVEVTAARDEVDAAMPAIELGRLAAFAHHRLPEALQRKLEAGPLAFALSAAFRFARLEFAQPLLLVGPSGAGKTLTVARLATRLVLAGKAPVVITADGRRAGAVEQLAAFTRLLGLELVLASQPSMLRKAIDERSEGAPVLIDSPGLDPFDAAQREELAGLATIAGAAMALVLPAGMDAEESADVAAALAACGVRLLVGTRFDVARRIGGLLAAAGMGLAMTEAGGVGKTWFAITLAHALARAGKRVLLFDGDLGLANVDVQLGLMPPVDLAAVVSGRTALDRAVLRHEGGFDIVAGRSGSGALSAMDGAALEVVLESLRSAARGYDVVVLDLGAGLDRAVRRMAVFADMLLVVATDDPASLTDAYAVLKLYAGDVGAGPNDDARVVVNQAPTQAAGARTYGALARACTRFLGRKPALAGVVRRDERVRQAIRRQSLLLVRHPACAAALDVEAVAGALF